MNIEPMPTDDLPDRLPTPQRRALTALLVLLALAALDQTIVSTALPAITADLRDGSRLSWVFSAYLVTSTVAVPLYGRLADRFGAKPVVLAATLLFLAGSLLCGFSTHLDMLILARALQGAGGGGFMILTMTAMGQMLPPAQRGRLQGLAGGVFGIATMVGPVVGGLMVQHLSWRWAFFINVPLALAAGIALAIHQPRYAVEERRSIDYIGALLLTVALTCMTLATSREAPPIGSTTTLTLAALVFAAIFLWCETRVASPLLPLSMFRHPAFTGATIVSASSGVMLYVVVVFMPLYFQTHRGLLPSDSGWHLLPLMVGITAGSTGSGRVLSATGKARDIGLAATLLATAGFATLALLMHGHDAPLTLLSAILVPLGIGIGALFPLITLVSQSTVSPALLGIATASPVMIRLVAGAVSVAALATLLLAVIGKGEHMDIAQAGLSPRYALGMSWVWGVAALISAAGVFASLTLPAQLERRRPNPHQDSSVKAPAHAGPR
jgi:EmrB/QacA subfamily drug resistance transporter